MNTPLVQVCIRTAPKPTKATETDRDVYYYCRQKPSMTTTASHTYRTVTLTRYTLNYATLPGDLLCRPDRKKKKKKKKH